MNPQQITPSTTPTPTTTKRRELPVGFLVSVGVHLLLFIALITVKIVQYISEPAQQTFTANTSRTPNVTPKREIKTKIGERQRATGGGQPPKVTIASERPSTIMVPKVLVPVSHLRSGLNQRGTGRTLGPGTGETEGPGGPGGPPSLGGPTLPKLLDLPIESNRLGVVVDNSGSMKPFLEKLRTEINNTFKDRADYVEANGCSITPSSPAFLAIKQMAEGGKVDAIFWFSDLNDPLDMGALKVLSEILLDKKIKLYVRSIKLRPTDPSPTQPDRKKEGKLLQEIIHDSGGKLKVEPSK